MLEAAGNIWDMECDALCITTNGFVKNSGQAVMGRGIAKQAKEKFLGLEYTLGLLITNEGNLVHYLIHDTEHDVAIWSFPVKHNWWESAEIDLIVRSCAQLMYHVEGMNYKRVLLPRPGCGNGGLKWEEVKPTIEQLLDDRITVVNYAT